MSILARYIIKEYLKVFLMTLSILSLIFLMIHFLEKIRKFSEHHAEINVILIYFLYKIPKMVSDIMPLAILLSTLFTLGRFSKNNETVAVIGAGISVLQFTAPLLIFSMLASLLSFYLNSTVIPNGLKHARKTQEIKIEKKQDAANLIQSKIWFRLDHRTLFYTQEINPASGSMQGIHIYYMGDDFTLQEEIDAKALTYAHNEWTLSQGTRRVFMPDGSVTINPFQQMGIELNKTQSDFQEAAVIPIETTDQQLNASIAQLTRDGLNATRYRIDLQSRWAFSCASFILVLMGIPFCLQRPMGGARSFVLSLLIGLSYWVISSVMISLGYTTILPPLMSAWGANLFFLLLGGYLFRNMSYA